jgi:hypothetical protein
MFLGIMGLKKMSELGLGGLKDDRIRKKKS